MLSLKLRRGIQRWLFLGARGPGPCFFPPQQQVSSNQQVPSLHTQTSRHQLFGIAALQRYTFGYAMVVLWLIWRRLTYVHLNMAVSGRGKKPAICFSLRSFPYVVRQRYSTSMTTGKYTRDLLNPHGNGTSPFKTCKQDSPKLGRRS